MKEKGNFQSEKIDVNWISFKFQSLEIKSQSNLVNYLFELGFNSYVQSGKLIKSEKKDLKVNHNKITFLLSLLKTALIVKAHCYTFLVKMRINFINMRK